MLLRRVSVHVLCVCVEEAQGRLRFGLVICPARQQQQEVGRSDWEE